MSSRARMAAIGAAVAVLAVVAFFVLSGQAGNLPIPGLQEDPKCPLTGEAPESENLVDRPAVGVKIENAAVARPLAGLERADLVYEELVEGGATRFMAIFHCGDSSMAGPVRSARVVDPSILKATTRILAFSGGNKPVLDALDEGDIVQIDESKAGNAMERVERPGITSDHTLYANTSLIRKIGRRRFDDPPPDDTFSFGDLDARGRRARTISLEFGGSSTITYEWSKGRWQRSQDGAPFLAEAGEQIGVDNIVVELHEVNFSETIVDVAGNPSIEIADETGTGRAVLFRDGRAVAGTWTRDSVDAPVTFETKAGDEMVFAPGSVWIELLPDNSGEVKGSFSYER